MRINVMLGLALACVGCVAMPERERVGFVEVSGIAGLHHAHRVDRLGPKQANDFLHASGGAAAGDYDGDGFVDLFLVGGMDGSRSDMLWRNAGDGTFEAVIDAGFEQSALGHSNGPLFADVDGDGLLDLLVGGVASRAFTGVIRPPRLQAYRNLGDGRFSLVTEESGLTARISTASMSMADYDLDGDLDLAIGHWTLSEKPQDEYLWENIGGFQFRGATRSAGVAAALTTNFVLTPVFSDIDADAWPDLLFVSDFGNTQVFLNQNGFFREGTDPGVITDENGMGTALGDYDGDGDLDWFVTSIFDPGERDESSQSIYAWGASGNRLYRNEGGGVFRDVTDVAGVRRGAWGWAACFADFDNDGHLDIFHVNGYGDPRMRFWRDVAAQYVNDSSKLFMSNGDGSFTEKAAEYGIADTGQGRGVVCFDFDRDGDLDILVANNGQPARLYRNDFGNQQNHLAVKLEGRAPNTQAIGAWVSIEAGGRKQVREIRAGSNYLSQDPAEAHFGLGDLAAVDRIEIIWPAIQGEARHRTVFEGVDTNQLLVIPHPDHTASEKNVN